MAFGHGKDGKLYAHGVDLTPYTTSVEVSGSVDTAETSALGDTSKSYLAGLIDHTLSADGYIDGGSGANDELLESIAGDDDKVVSTYFQGDTLGSSGKHIRGAETSASSSPDIGGASAFAFDAQSENDAEMADSLKSGDDSITASDDGDALDGTSSSSDGGSAYLHVLSKSGGTTVDVDIEDSADGSTDWQSIGSFTQASAAGVAERIAIVGTIRRFTRASWTLGSGGTWSVNVAIRRA